MQEIDPEYCEEKECHLKCSLAQKCMICKKKRVSSSDWRMFVFLALVPLLLVGPMALVAAEGNADPSIKGVKLPPQDFLASASWIIGTALLVSGILIYVAISRGRVHSGKARCCYEHCSANLRRKSCSECGHPISFIPAFYYYFAGIIGLPSLVYGTLVFILPTSGSPATYTLGVGGLIIGGGVILSSVIGILLAK